MSSSFRHTSPRKASSPTYRDAFAQAGPVGGQVTLKSIIPPPPCSMCHEQITMAKHRQTLSKSKLGMIARLPPQSQVPAWSIAHNQPQLNGGAFNHPGAVITDSACGHLCLVAPATSFHGGGIQVKYSNASTHKQNDVFWEYLALSHPDIQAANDLQVLVTANGDLPKPTYVHLDGLYWIEMTNLGDYNGNAESLTESSRQYLEWAALIAQQHRVKNGLLAYHQRITSPTTPALQVRPCQSTARATAMPVRTPLGSLLQAPAAKPQGVRKPRRASSTMDWSKLGKLRAAATVAS